MSSLPNDRIIETIKDETHLQQKVEKDNIRHFSIYKCKKNAN